MYEDENEQPVEKAKDVQTRAMEALNQFRLHAEIAAIFEGTRKFDAVIRPDLAADVAREIQRAMAKLEKSLEPNIPIIPPAHNDVAAEALSAHHTYDLPTNDYHIHRRPGETMIVRWLEGDEVDAFYGRLQAHFEAMLAHAKEEERLNNEWKQDEQSGQYREVLEKVDIKLPDRWLRDPIKEHKIFVLSTQMADEMNIAFIAEHVMGTDPAEIVGAASAPPDNPTEQDLAWFYKLFMLRGVRDAVEQMCFFTFLQKTDEAW